MAKGTEVDMLCYSMESLKLFHRQASLEVIVSSGIKKIISQKYHTVSEMCNTDKSILKLLRYADSNSVVSSGKI